MYSKLKTTHNKPNAPQNLNHSKLVLQKLPNCCFSPHKFCWSSWYRSKHKHDTQPQQCQSAEWLDRICVDHNINNVDQCRSGSVSDSVCDPFQRYWPCTLAETWISIIYLFVRIIVKYIGHFIHWVESYWIFTKFNVETPFVWLRHFDLLVVLFDW